MHEYSYQPKWALWRIGKQRLQFWDSGEYSIVYAMNDGQIRGEIESVRLCCNAPLEYVHDACYHFEGLGWRKNFGNLKLFSA
jgi:hypothetical protein